MNIKIMGMRGIFLKKNRWCFIFLILFIFSIFWIIFAKEKVKVDELIFNYVDRNCSNQVTCVVDLTSIIPLIWDNAYIFKQGNKDEVEDKIGVAYPDYKDSSTSKIIFTYAGKVIHAEENYVDFDFAVPKAKELIFTFDKNNINNYHLLPDDAKFSVQKELKHYRRRSKDIELYNAKRLHVSDMKRHPQTLWQITKAIPKKIPFNKTNIEQLFGTRLIEANSNEYTQLWKSTAISLQDNLTISNIDLRINRKKPDVGFLAINLAEQCITLNEVKQHYPKLEITGSPRGRSLYEATNFSTTQPWGLLSFGFQEIAPDCLAYIVFDPDK